MTDWSPIGSHSDLTTLQRSTDSRVAGVCGGLGARFGIDPNIVRVAFVVLALAGGAGFLAYLGAWILLPAADQRPGDERSNRSLMIGGALLTIAGLMALLTVGGVEPVGTAIFGLLFAGIVILNRRPAGADDPAGFGGPTAPPPPTPPPPPSGAPAGFSPMGFSPTDTLDPSAFDSPPPTPSPDWAPPDPVTEAPDPPSVVPDATAEFTDLAASGPDPTTELALELTPQIEDLAVAAEPSAPIPEPLVLDGLVEEPWLDPIQPDPMEANSRTGMTLHDPTSRTHWAVTKTAEETSLTAPGGRLPTGPPLASISLAAMLAILGVALVLNTVAGIYVGATTVVGAATAVVGLMMAVSAFRGRTFPLVPLAVMLLILLTASPILDQIIRDGTGSTYVTVAGTEDLADSYRLGVGELNLDLSRVEISEDTEVEVEIGTGSLEILLPPDTAVAVKADSRVGYISVLGEERAGIGNQLEIRPSVSIDDDTPVLTLDVSAEIGSVDIYRNQTVPFEDTGTPVPFEDLPGPEPTEGIPVPGAEPIEVTDEPVEVTNG